jgi:type VI secretion system protein ImpG
MSETARREGPRSGYVGSEVFVALVDPDDAPYNETLRQLALQTRCTNRDLPLFMPGSSGRADYTMDAGLPLIGVKAVAGPSRPHTALREGGVAWRLLNLLSLNYLSLLDTMAAAGAMRGPLAGPQGPSPPYSGRRGTAERCQLNRAPHPMRGPIAFGRGIEVRLTVDEVGHTEAAPSCSALRCISTYRAMRR